MAKLLDPIKGLRTKWSRTILQGSRWSNHWRKIWPKMVPDHVVALGSEAINALEDHLQERNWSQNGSGHETLLPGDHMGVGPVAVCISQSARLDSSSNSFHWPQHIQGGFHLYGDTSIVVPLIEGPALDL